MAKKLVVRRDLRKPRGGGAPYLKYLVFSALGLIFLVVITPYLLKDRGGEATNKKPVPERGAITKELPKQAQQQPAPEKPDVSATAATTPETVGSTVPGAASTVSEPSGTVKSPEAQPAPAGKATGSSMEASSPETIKGPPPAPPETASPPAQTAELAQPSEKPQAPQEALFPASPKASAPAQTPKAALFPKKKNRFEAAMPENVHAKAVRQTAARMHPKKAALSAKPARKPMDASSAKPAVCPSAKGSYAVQVGSIFRTFGQAESLRKRLAAKGYTTSIRHVARLGYLVVTCSCTRSNAYTLREQMSTGGLSNVKVVPVDPNAH